MSGALPPKLRTMRMLDLVTLNVIVTFVVATLHETAEAGPMRPDRIIGGVAGTAVLWLVVFVVDLVAFPRTNMVPFVLTQAVPVAAVTATVWTLFIGVVQGPAFQLAATWVGAFIAHLALATLWGFIPEWRRARRAVTESDAAGVPGDQL